MSQFKLNQNLKQAQTFSFSYGMKLSLELLQLNSMQLAEVLERELLDNPLYEIEYLSFSSGKDIEDISSTGKSLLEEISGQIETDKVNMNVVETLLMNIDGNGYLKVEVLELVKALKCSGKEIEKIRKMIMCLQPYGICAKDLKECLLIQAKMNYPKKSKLHQLIEFHLEDLANHYVDKIRKALLVTQDELEKLIQMLRSFDPRPASEYNISQAQMTKPEFILIENEGHIEIQPIRYFNIHRVNKFSKKDLNSDEKKWIQQMQVQGDALVEGLIKREETLTLIMKEIVSVQEQCILEHSPLKPLKQKEIAERLKLHETTISRALKDKMFEFENQSYWIRSLFSNQVTADGVSKDQICLKIQYIIKNEDKRIPFSDQKIVELLCKENIKIARRTVTKYRELMGIAKASTRVMRGN